MASPPPLSCGASTTGALLVLHRVLQQIRRGVDVRLPPAVETGLSWAVSFAAISVGWILFRAQSLPHALSMLDALLTPSRYTLLTLPGGTYALVLAVFAAYFTYSVAWVPLMRRFRTKLWGERKIMRESPHLQFCKWSSMSAAIFWMLVYVLSEAAEKLPNFVYVNF